MKHYLKIKREKVGRCNLCLEEKSLSWDHVPPKGGCPFSKVQLEHTFSAFVNDHDKKIVAESQNGMKYRTICSDCNSFLGKHYDPILNEFVIGVGRYLLSVMHFPKVVMHKTKPVALAKCVLAHLVAARITVGEGDFDEQIRDMIFDFDKPIPEKIHVFYWLYPYYMAVVMRDFGMPAVRGVFGHGGGYFNVLKYFPIGFLTSTLGRYESLDALTSYRHLDTFQDQEIPISLSRIEHPLWPEAPGEDSMLMVGESARESLTAKYRGKIVKG